MATAARTDSNPSRGTVAGQGFEKRIMGINEDAALFIIGPDGEPVPERLQHDADPSVGEQDPLLFRKAFMYG